MYKTIEKFLKDPNPAEYDFKNEYAFKDRTFPNNNNNDDITKNFRAFSDKAVEDIQNDKDPIRKVLKHKFYGKYSDFDCDNSNGTCSLTGEIFELLWKESGAYSANSIWGGDVMNSFWTTCKIAIQITENKKASVRGKPYLSEIENLLVKENYDKILKKMKEKCFYKDLEEFASFTHTIGNMVLVPKGFNGGRFLKTNDYWDASLLYLQSGEWFEGTKAGKAWSTKYSQNQDDDSGFSANKWFNKYIEDHFLCKYVVKTENERYGIKSLFRSTESEMELLEKVQAKAPNSDKQLKYFLENVNGLIKCRGKGIVDKLKELES